MAGFIGQALSALLRENDDILSHAKSLAGHAACRIHRVEEAKDLTTGEKTVRWQIEFKNVEDATAFDNAVRGLVQRIVEEE
jgi:hypothetical protein